MLNIQARWRVVLQLSATADWQGGQMERPRCVIFKWRQLEPAIIAASVSWGQRHSLSPRVVEESPIECGAPSGHAAGPRRRATP
ncbi:MAG: hypothetical protein Q8N47_09645, partial [Bryobacterales bacterium]|nr:hypothetical protein [Bryobacterales bacterium]